MLSAELQASFGEIDIYLFDQLLRGRFDGRRRILDAGCGGGRNLPFFVRNGFEVYAVDGDAAAVAAARQLVASLNPSSAPEQIQQAPVESLPWPSQHFDAVICSAVLHFARDDEHFGAMLREMWRVLAPGGLFFARLATSIGIEARLARATGRVRLPDGSDRYVVDERTLLDWTEQLGGRLLDPIKTTNVQQMRCMTTWVLSKNQGPGT